MDDIISDNQTIKTIKKLIEMKVLPHLLFCGISGTGKTSTVMAIAKELYGNNINLMTMKLDASDDRGINSVREDIKGFAQKTNMFIKGIKLIILDEADAMTFDAQFALRRIIEQYSSSVRFCLICNYENKIIPAIRSRFLNLRFNTINKEFIINKLNNISIIENINIIPEALNTIAIFSNGDLRKAINLLQSLSMQDNLITSKLCHEIIGIPLKSEVLFLLDILNDKFKLFNEKYNIISNFIKDRGYLLNSVIKEIFNILLENNIEPYIILKLAELENIISKSSYNNLYISSLISIFL
jgi:replication factor C subunit 3/5